MRVLGRLPPPAPDAKPSTIPMAPDSTGVVEGLAGRGRGRGRRRRCNRARTVHRRRRRRRRRRRAADHRRAVNRCSRRRHDHVPAMRTSTASAGLRSRGDCPLPLASCALPLSPRLGSPLGARARKRLGRLGRDGHLRLRRRRLDHGRRDRDHRLHRTRLRRGLLCHERDRHRQRGNGHNDSDACAVLARHVTAGTC